MQATQHNELQAPPYVVFTDAAITRDGTTIWSHGTFAIPSGTITAIVGTNGTGKTTLLNAELGLLPLSHGSIEVLGALAGTNNHRIGYVPQNYTSGLDSTITVEQSVLLGLQGTHFGWRRTTAAQWQQVREALEVVHLTPYADARLGELSGGQRQRAAIAQALASKPELLLLDEPLANLDIASQQSLVDLLATLNAQWDMSVQVVSHDLNMLLPILTGAIYLLDGHPHYASMSQVLDAKLLTHLYGTEVQVVTTPQGDMFVTPNKEVHYCNQDTHNVLEAAQFHAHEHEHEHEHDREYTHKRTNEQVNNHTNADHEDSHGINH